MHTQINQNIILLIKVVLLAIFFGFQMAIGIFCFCPVGGIATDKGKEKQKKGSFHNDVKKVLVILFKHYSFYFSMISLN